MKWACVSLCVHCHNRLVDPHIPVAALRAANPVLVKGPLNSWVTRLLHTHSQVKCMGTHIKWVCPVCKYAHTRHMDAHTHCKSKLRMVSPVHQMCVLFLASSVLFIVWLWMFPSWRLPEMSPDWKFDFHLLLCHHLCLSVCLALILSVHLSPYVCSSAPSVLCEQNRKWSQLEHLGVGHVHRHTRDYQVISDRQLSPSWLWLNVRQVIYSCKCYLRLLFHTFAIITAPPPTPASALAVFSSS